MFIFANASKSSALEQMFPEGVKKSSAPNPQLPTFWLRRLYQAKIFGAFVPMRVFFNCNVSFKKAFIASQNGCLTAQLIA